MPKQALTPSDIVQVSDKVRMDKGPARVTAVVTEELLSNAVTAQHYHAGLRDGKGDLVRDQKGNVVLPPGRDANGEMIEIGKEMTFLDWLGDHGWYVYVYGPVTVKIPMPDGQDLIEEVADRWVEDSFHKSRESALARAQSLAV